MTDQRLSFVDHIRVESARFREAMAASTPGTAVPTCPDWSADDLLWHLAEVQWFWGSIVAQGLQTAQDIEELEDPVHPSGRGELIAFFDTVSADLVTALDRFDPAEPRWMWIGDASLHTVGYIRRRQAHEALIHRIDAEVTSDLERAPIDRTLAADGVDEALRLMMSADPLPGWAEFTQGPALLRLEATDVGSTWLVAPGRFTGHDPVEDLDVDEAALRVLPADDGRHVAAQVSAIAADLDLWLWNRRPNHAPDKSGDDEALRVLDEIVRLGIS